MTQAELLFHEIAAALPEAQGGQLFGKPCYKIKGKAFVCFMVRMRGLEPPRDCSR